jgi:hypothetical protein
MKGTLWKWGDSGEKQLKQLYAPVVEKTTLRELMDR